MQVSLQLGGPRGLFLLPQMPHSMPSHVLCNSSNGQVTCARQPLCNCCVAGLFCGFAGAANYESNCAVVSIQQACAAAFTVFAVFVIQCEYRCTIHNAQHTAQHLQRHGGFLICTRACGVSLGGAPYVGGAPQLDINPTGTLYSAFWFGQVLRCAPLPGVPGVICWLLYVEAGAVLQLPAACCVVCLASA